MTVSQVHALASPDSASIRWGLFEVVAMMEPLSMTDSITSSATATMLAARRATGVRVVVAVSVTVRVVISRVVVV